MEPRGHRADASARARSPTGRSALSIVGLLGFGTVVLLAMVLLHSYLWWRLVRSTTDPGRTRRRLTWLTVALALLPVLAILTRRTLPLEAAAPLDWLAYCWLGVAFYTFLTLLALEPVRLAAPAVGGGESAAHGCRAEWGPEGPAQARRNGSATRGRARKVATERPRRSAEWGPEGPAQA